MKVKIRLWIATIPQAESRNDGVVKFSVCKVMDCHESRCDSYNDESHAIIAFPTSSLRGVSRSNP
ncbi:hypothetical protein [Helicobacter sp.]|uniref:hypothetical protein n=1 Tax=Helicobacter sp. TaxID=218 RepID=UPI002A90B696|nr:hypothetical protein [Helicobacter sp.]MDY5556499.1 hypothetical protein [Helicobacter sp.]